MTFSFRFILLGFSFYFDYFRLPTANKLKKSEINKLSEEKDN